jgi:hypothetical protein
VAEVTPARQVTTENGSPRVLCPSRSADCVLVFTMALLSVLHKFFDQSHIYIHTTKEVVTRVPIDV